MARLSFRSTVCITILTSLLAGPRTGTAQVAAPPALPPSAEMVKRVTTPTEKVATVGDQTIFAGDVLPTIDQMLQEVKDKIPPEQLDQLDVQRAIYVRQLLPRKIEAKLVLLDFYRTIPADKLDEVLANIEKQVDKQFYEEQVPQLQKQFKVEFLNDLNTKLRSFGSSMEVQKAAFREQMIARTMIGQKVDRNPEVTHTDLLDYYHEHIDNYEVKARARWEKLTALFEEFSDKPSADRAIVEMGNQVLRGASFSSVASKHSQGTNAWKGGQHDWTTQGSLISSVLDQAIFSVPLNQLSSKLEDDRGIHIIRVLEREDARQISFEEAQEGIRTKLQEEQRQMEMREYLDGLREKTFVWTVFDDPSK